jgi:HAD superfamily hydrolase (TIGR01509 family)
VTINAIIFDYGGVLMRTVDPRPRRELERDLGLEPFGADRLVFGHPLWDRVQVGEATSDDFWAAIAARLARGAVGLEEFRRRFWSGDRLDERLVSLLHDLRERGYRMGLLSNNPASLRQRVERLMPGLFESFVISGQDGVMKPDMAIYELAVSRLGVEAGEAVFVDDAERNVVGARAAGLEAVLFRGLAPLRRDLRDLGVSITAPLIGPVPGIKAVIFDWGGVLELLPDDRALDPWAARLGLGTAELRTALWGPNYYRMSAGWISADEYVRRVARATGHTDVGATMDLLQAVHAHNRLDGRVLDAVRVLRAEYRVALLTNSYAGLEAGVRDRHGIELRQEFDVYVNSADIGLRKPDPDIFELTLERLGCQPGQAILVDDGLRNVDAAEAVGLHTIQHLDGPSTAGLLEAMLGHPLEA